MGKKLCEYKYAKTRHFREGDAVPTASTNADL